MAVSNSQQLEALLCQVFVPDTGKIKEAETALKQYCKNNQCVPGLLEQITTSQQPQARQLAAILLKKKLGNHIDSFDAATRAHIRQTILDQILKEPMHNIRTAIAGAVSSLAAATVSIDEEGNRTGGLGTEWPQLLEFVAQCTNSTEEDHREVSFVILEQIVECCGEDLQPHLANLNGLFMHALTQDPSRKTQDAALKCISALLIYMSMEQEALVFRNLIGVMLQMVQGRLQQAAANNYTDDDILQAVGLVLEVLTDCAMSPIALINPYIETMVPLCLEVIQKDEINTSVRDSACLLLNGLAEAKPKQFAKKGNLPQVILELTKIMAKSEGSASGELFTSGLEDDDDDDDEEDRDPSGMAQTVLDAIALSIPTKYVFQPAMHIMATFIANPDPKMRKAAMALLAVVTEGCQVPLSEHISEVMPQVVTSCSDADHLVRQSACFALGQMSEHCQPEVFQYHEQILPAVFTLFDDETTQVKGMSCYVLEMFCENLEPETLRPFLEPLMTKLVATLQTHPKKSIQEMVLAAMAAIAVGAEESFVPFFKPVAELLMQLIFQTEEAMLPLRGRALECMGHFAVAVKKETFQPYITQCMESAAQNLQIPDNTDLHEYSYAFFANLARVLEGDFAPYLPQLVPHLCTQLTESDGKDIEFGEKEGAGGFGNFAADSEDEDDDEDKYVVNIRTAELEKRKACLTALGAMAQFTGGTAFQPYLESSMQAMESCCEYWNGLVRQEAALSLPQLVVACNKAFPSPAGDWVKGNPQPLSPQTQTLAIACLELLTGLIEGDFDREVVAKAVESIEVIVMLLGPALLQVYDATKLMNLTMTLLQNKAPCQEEDDDEEEDDEQTDHDHVLIDNVADLIGAYAKALGDAFVTFFDGFFNVLKTYMSGTRPANDRSMAIGCCADCITSFDSPEIVTKYFRELIDTLKLGLADGSYNIRRNSAFCMGILCEGSKGAMADRYPELLQSVSPLFEPVPNTDGAAMDNAASAVCRMIKSSPSGVPLSQVLPVVLNALPLKVDMSENELVYEVLVSLIKMQAPDALSSLPQMLGVFASALQENSKVDDEVKEKLKGAVKETMVAIPDQMNAAISALPADIQNFYRQI